jgi:NTE family protein
VLEGGAALGLVHIGVLQWMEEHRISVDYVAGISMGGLIGGAYSTGMRPAEIRQLVKSIDWEAVLRGSSEYADRSFRRKEDRRAYPNSLEFGLRKGVKFPGGFNSGQQIDFILDRIALPYSTVKSFDDLPIPFRCIGTDLVSRSMHVFQDGSFSMALRSTMSIPGLFTPVKDFGRIYVDGGLLDNLPTDVAREMGPDVIIGVHFDEAPLSPETSLSSLGAISQSFSAITATNERRGMELADVLVRVDVRKFTGYEFTQADKLIETGYKAAQKSEAVLMKYAMNESEWQLHLKQREARRIQTVPVPSFINVTGTKVERADAIERDLQRHLGKQIDDAQLEHELNLLLGEGRFGNAVYTVTEVEQRSGLHIKLSEKEYAPPTVNPIVLIDGSQYNNVLFSAGARFTFLDMGKPGAELRTDLLAGSTYRFSAEYYRPLYRSPHWFLAPRAKVDSVALNLYQQNTQLGAYRRAEAGGGLDVGYQFDRFSEFRFGYATGWQSYDLKVGDPNLLPTASGRLGASRLRYVLDHLDSPVVPSKGLALESEFNFYDSRPAAEDMFPALQTTVHWFKPLRAIDSVYLKASGGTTFGFEQTGVPPFKLGGPMWLSAYSTNEIFTNQYSLFQTGYLRQIGHMNPILGNEVYITAFYELAHPSKTQNPDLNRFPDLPMDGGAGFIANTILGPVYLGGAWGDSGHRKIFFSLGRVF